MVESYCVCAQRLSQETAGQSRVGVGSTSHEKDTILKGRALSGGRDGLFVCRLMYRQVLSLSILYTLLLLLLLRPVFQSSVASNGVPLVRRRCARITSAAGSREEEASEVRQ